MVEKKELGIMDLPGVGPNTQEKLKLAGMDNLLAIAVTSIGKLLQER